MRRFSLALFLLIASPLFAAESLFLGTFVMRKEKANPRPETIMTVTDQGGGNTLITYTTPGKPQKLTVLSRGEGEDAQVLLDGKPTGQTMAITRSDARHRSTILKFQGKQTGSSRAEISADGKVITVETEMDIGGQMHKATERWDRQ